MCSGLTCVYLGGIWTGNHVVKQHVSEDISDATLISLNC